jgi:hypothetical protein
MTARLSNRFHGPLSPEHEGRIYTPRSSVLLSVPHPSKTPEAFARYVAAADQPDIRDGVVRGSERPCRDQRRAIAGEAGDASYVHRHGLSSLTCP